MFESILTRETCSSIASTPRQLHLGCSGVVCNKNTIKQVRNVCNIELQVKVYVLLFGSCLLMVTIIAFVFRSELCGLGLQKITEQVNGSVLCNGRQAILLFEL